MAEPSKDSKPAATGDDKPGAPPGGKKADEAKKKGGAKPPKAKMSRGKKLAIGVLVAIAFIGLAYGIGRLQGWLATNEWTERAETAERTALLYQARHQLDQAWHALDNDNFGEARSHVANAARTLGTANEDDEAVRKLAKELSDLQLVVSDPAEMQKADLRGYMNRIEELTTPGPEDGEGS